MIFTGTVVGMFSSSFPGLLVWAEGQCSDRLFSSEGRPQATWPGKVSAYSNILHVLRDHLQNTELDRLIIANAAKAILPYPYCRLEIIS